ncbi:MAG: hypothetical protein ABSE08_08670 [Syntrophobacteraceae bacterium]|jgi:hypothetical protein
MTDQNTDRSKMSSGCFAGMPEMMRKMMSKKGGSCCPCAETMSEMMPECCQVQTEKESPAEKPDRNAPK